MSIDNLEAMLRRADPIDLDEGMVAYERYHMVMQRIASRFCWSMPAVTAAFVSLSPNSDYFGNLRSTISLLDGIKRGLGPDQITVSTYGHCKRRAYAYAMGDASFLLETKGPKITNFYHNIVDPRDGRWVTIDGHMSAIWQGKNLTMREALIPARTYARIRDDLLRLAFRNFMLPNQLQAILWFTRKRVDNIVYDPQLQLFAERGDVWATFRDINQIDPYPFRSKADDTEAPMVHARGPSTSEAGGQIELATWERASPPIPSERIDPPRKPRRRA
jgi:hypothetical protein